MNKKTYVAPRTRMVCTEGSLLMAASAPSGYIFNNQGMYADESAAKRDDIGF